MGGGNTLNDNLENLIASSCIEIRNALLSEYSDYLDVDHSFSDRFNQRIAALLRRIKVQQTVVLILRYAAVIIISISIIGGTIFTVNVEARNKFKKWVVNIFDDSIVFENSNTGKESLGDYIISFNDESYVFNLISDVSFANVYEILDNKEQMILTAQIEGDYSALFITDYQCFNVDVNGSIGIFYEVFNNDGTNELYWTDRQSDIILHLSAKLNQNDMLELASKITVNKNK